MSGHALTEQSRATAKESFIAKLSHGYSITAAVAGDGRQPRLLLP